MKITTCKTQKNGKTAWRVEWRSEGKRVRHFHPTRASAEAEADQLRRQEADAGRVWLTLSARERSEFLHILAEIREAGLTLRQVWDNHSAPAAPTAKPVTIADAIDACLADKHRINLRPNYVKGLERYLRMFARGRESAMIGEFTSEDIRAWIDARREKPATQHSNLGRIASLFAFAVESGMIPATPVRGLKRPKFDQAPPRILSVREAAKLLALAHRHVPKLTAWLALCLFAGVRPEEADAVTWGNVRLDADPPVAVIAAEGSKVRRRRLVPLPIAAQGWLRVAKSLGVRLPMPTKTRKAHQIKLRNLMGWAAWPQDVLRHSAASYLIASQQDVGKVARALGNSPDILLRHYTELVSVQDAAKFWRLSPRPRHSVKGRGTIGGRDGHSPDLIPRIIPSTQSGEMENHSSLSG